MSFTRVNIAGWALNEPLSSAQANNLDIDHANAIDGADGGIYSPSSPVQIDHLHIQTGGGGFTVDSGASATFALGSTVAISGAWEATNGSMGILRATALLEVFGSLQWKAGVYPEQTVRDEFRVLSMTRLFEIIDTGAGALPWTPGDFGWEQTTVAGAIPEILAIPGDNLVSGGQLFGAKVWVEGSAGHGGLPAVMPQIIAYEISNAGAVTSLGSASDASVDVPAYEAAHTIELTFAARPALDEAAGTRVILYFIGESGANKQAGLRLYSAVLEFTSTTNRPGG